MSHGKRQLAVFYKMHRGVWSSCRSTSRADLGVEDDQHSLARLDFVKMATEVNFCPGGPLDEFLEEGNNYHIEHGFDDTVESMAKKGRTDAEIAVWIVERWLLDHSYMSMYHDDTVDIVSGREAAGLGEDTPYLKVEFWQDRLKNDNYTACFWDNLFLGGNYLSRNISDLIPDDEMERMVLHFLRNWRSRMHSYITDTEVPEECRLAVLRKQVENFTFIYRKMSFGDIWKMNSEPNVFLSEALEAGGSVVLDERDITGGQVTVTADSSIPKSAGEGPTPDDTDRKIYHYIVKYAKQRLGSDEVHDSWSMVKASFDKGVNVRCYAFSGHKNSSKDLHEMPQHWFKQNSGPDAFGDEMEVDVCNVDCKQLGQNMVLAVFRALKSQIEEDLKKLTTYIAFEEMELSQSLILDARKDMTSMDYGLYYDIVIEKMNNYDTKLYKAIGIVVENKMKDIDPATVIIEDIKCLVSVGGKNQSFSPKEKELEKYLLKKFNNDQEKAQKTLAILVNISKKLAEQLEKLLGGLPDKYLSHVEEKLKTSRCGEDNVIALVLHKVFSQYVNSCFLKANVKFVSLDSDHMEGKPFCSVCGYKVKFYSILPFVLRFTGYRH